jgi:TRAP-type C4-dicarboxylate transport system substrate-binding protein
MEGDTLFPEFLRTVECRGGVTAPIADVLPGLTAGRIDTVVASPTAVSALQWHTRLTHVMQQSNAVLVGATLFSREDVQALPADLQEVLRTTGAQAHQRLSEAVRREDDRYFQTLTAAGGTMTTVDASPHEAAWRAAAQQTRERMVGPVFSRELLDRVLAARGH